MNRGEPDTPRKSERTGLRFRIAGTGPNLVLVSGLNGKADFWNSCLEKLTDDFRVLTFDQRGCGATPDDKQEWTVETLSDDALELADEVFEHESYAVIGHSTGGAIAQCMLMRRPKTVLAGILSGTWERADNYMRTLFELRISLLERAPDLDPILSHLLRNTPENFPAMDETVALDPDVSRRRICALLAHDATPILPELKMPVLVIGAEDDRIVPKNLSRQIHEDIAHSDLCLLSGGGHFFPQTRTAEFIAKVTAWLQISFVSG